MIEIGGRPILWHIMRYYAAWGHDDFILCLGYKGEVVKEYFLYYNGALLNDFVLDRNGERHEGRAALARPRGVADHVRRHRANATIGERLKAVGTASRRRRDVPRDLRRRAHRRRRSPALIDRFHESGKTAMFLSVRPQFNAHLVSTDADGNVVGSRT